MTNNNYYFVFFKFFNSSKISLSFSLSKELVISSKIMISLCLSNPLAIDNLCFSPPDKFQN